MKAHAFSLTKNELELMRMLWAEGKPLARSQIINLSPDRSWKAASIHILLNQLLEKGVVVVDGYTKTGKNYGRTYAAAITPEEYQLRLIKESSAFLPSKSSALIHIMSALIQDAEINAETLEQLKAILQERSDAQC
ncbi:MAG: BlaI/MecI/CopY family transcriptional regulator [Peptococcaceae bacterium]|jgi:predicted transcriptional regulator|nr:BlaI/MecI/CopY family transcriptional regulator [Peptococcaceae bacterium]